MLGQEPLMFFCLSLICNSKNCEHAALIKMEINFVDFADSHRVILFKAIGQPLVIAERVWGNHCEMAKSYWIASGQF